MRDHSMPATAPPLTPHNELPYGPSQVPPSLQFQPTPAQPPSQFQPSPAQPTPQFQPPPAQPPSQFQPLPAQPPPYARLPPPYTVNVNDPVPVPEPETRVIYVVQDRSECSVIGRLCCIRLMGVIMGLVIAGIIITFVTSTTSNSRY